MIKSWLATCTECPLAQYQSYGVDNTAAIDVAHDVGVSARTKHFDRAIHYLRDLVQLRRVIPVFVRTHLQRADGLTKALDKSKYFDWLKMFFT